MRWIIHKQVVSKLAVVTVVLCILIILLSIFAFKSTKQHAIILPEYIKTYENQVHEYSFQYPGEFDVIEYTSNMTVVATSTSSGVSAIFEIDVYTEGDIIDHAKSLCAADGPESTIYCDEIIDQKNIKTKSGLVGTSFYERRVTENLETREKSVEDYGPLYVFGNVIIHPPYLPSGLDPDNSIIDFAAHTFTSETLSSYATTSTSTEITTPTTPAPLGSRTAEDLSLQQGATGVASGLRITFNAITADSRCPADATCIQAGSITARLTLESKNGLATTLLSSDGETIVFNGYRISIIDVNPAKFTNTDITQDKYALTFHVTPTTAKNTI